MSVWHFFGLVGVVLLAFWFVRCGAPQTAAMTVDMRNQLYLFEVDSAIDHAHTCAEAVAGVADVQRRWLPAWPTAPLPIVRCPTLDAGVRDAASDAH